MNTNGKPKVVSLFSGAGCFDIGFEAAGFSTVLTTDIQKDCCDSISKNRDWLSIPAPIEALTNRDLGALTLLRPKELDVLIGGPPCQPYSKSSYGTTDGSPLGFDDERASTVREYMRIVDHFQPRVFVIENVPQFISGANTRVKEYIQRTTSKINSKRRTNYQLSFCKINAAWYGVPQLRERIFIVGVRNGQKFEMPEIRFLNTGDEELRLLPFRNCWDAIGSVKLKKNESGQVGGRWGQLLDSVPPGQNYLWHTERGGGRNIFEWRARYWNFLLKLHPLQPSWTIAANPGSHTGPFHWLNRRLTVSELKALQTIPEKYVFSGGPSSVRRQIGNGVPSALGELIGKEIRRQIFGEQISSTKLKLIPEKRPLTAQIKRLGQNFPVLPPKDIVSQQVASR